MLPPILCTYSYGTKFLDSLGMLYDDNESLEYREAFNLELRPHSGRVGGRRGKGPFEALGAVPVIRRGGSEPKLAFTAVSEIQEAYSLYGLKVLKFNLACPRYPPAVPSMPAKNRPALVILPALPYPSKLFPLYPLRKCHSNCASIVSCLVQASEIIFKPDPVQPWSPHKNPS